MKTITEPRWIFWENDGLTGIECVSRKYLQIAIERIERIGAVITGITSAW